MATGVSDDEHRLGALVDRILTRVDELESREAIREVLGRYGRAIDRLDRELLISCYHNDAEEEHGFFITHSAEEFADRALPGTKAAFESTFYSIGTVLINVSGDYASVESYCISGKVLKEPDEDGQKQLRLSGVRFLDRFERRDGEWRIAHRRLMGDWGFFHPTPTKTVGIFKFPPEGAMPPVGSRDETDPSYRLFHKGEKRHP